MGKINRIPKLDLITEAPLLSARTYRDFFRETYIAKEGKWKFLGIRNGNLYLLIVLSIAIATPILVGMEITEFKSIYFILIPIYFLIFNFFEWILPRYPLHHKIKGIEFLFEHVTVHHSFYNQKFRYYDQPKDYMAVFLPMLYFAFISLIFFLFGVCIYFISDLNNALLFETVVYIYYLMYETLHFSYHSRQGSFFKRMPFVERLSRFHLDHHHTELMDTYNLILHFPYLIYFLIPFSIPKLFPRND